MNFENFYEALQAVLNSHASDSDKLLIRNYLNKKTIKALETYTSFLDAIPKEEYISIAEELIRFSISYSEDSSENVEYKIYNFKKSIKIAEDNANRKQGKKVKSKLSQSIEIKQDTKVLRNAKNVLLKKIVLIVFLH